MGQISGGHDQIKPIGFKSKDAVAKHMKKANSRDSNKESGSDSGGSSDKSKHKHSGSRDSGSNKAASTKLVLHPTLMKHSSGSDQNKGSFSSDHEENGLVVTKKMIGDGHQAKVYVAEIRGSYKTQI